MNSEEKSNSQDVTMPTDRATFKILDYFKKEPSVGIACVSGLVVIVSFLVNIAVYLREVTYLDYWGLDSNYAFVSSPNQFYRVCGTVIHSIIITIALSIVNGAYEAFIPDRKYIYARRFRLRTISKRIKKTDKRLKQIQKQNPKKQTLQERIELRNLEKENKEHKKELHDIRKVTKNLEFDLIKFLLMHLVLTGVLLWIDVSLYFVLTGNPKNAIWYGLVFAVLFVGLLYGIAAFTHRKSFSKRELKENDGSLIKAYMEEWYANEKKYPIEWDWRHYLNDSNIISTLIASVLYVAMMLCMFSSFGWTEARQKDAFALIHNNDTAYAIVYMSGEIAILEECTTIQADDKLVIQIDAKKQKIIPLDDIDYEIIKFDEVKVSTPEK